MGGPSPNLGGRGGVMRSGVVLRETPHIRYNLFAGTDTLSLPVYELIAMQILLGGTLPIIWGKGQR